MQTIILIFDFSRCHTCTYITYDLFKYK